MDEAKPAHPDVIVTDKILSDTIKDKSARANLSKDDKARLHLVAAKPRKLHSTRSS